MERPRPQADAMTAPYWAAAKEGRLLVAECDLCSSRHAPPEAQCPRCGGDWHWAESPGVGRVYTYSVVHRPAGPGFETPYVLAVVELDDGWTMITNIVGCPPESVECDQPVEVDFEVLDDEVSLPVFRPV
jgi:hypothetical protein